MSAGAWVRLVFTSDVLVQDSFDMDALHAIATVTESRHPGVALAYWALAIFSDHVACVVVLRRGHQSLLRSSRMVVEAITSASERRSTSVFLRVAIKVTLRAVAAILIQQRLLKLAKQASRP